MPCENAAQSDDYFEFIGEYSGVVDYVKEEFNTECITVIDQRFAIAYVPKNGRTSIYGQNYPYNTIPRCFGLMDTQMLEDVGVAQVRRSTLELYGNGVLVGMIDTGIDYEHQAFRYEDGSSKIYSLWDQTIKGNPEDTFLGYGTEYTKEQIEEALRSKVPQEKVPSKDESGHGTFLAGLIAGNEDNEAGFSGIAPNAGLIVVKLRKAKDYLKEYYCIDPKYEVYAETEIMLAVRYIDAIAEQLQRPVVIFLGIGTSLASHLGTILLALVVAVISTILGTLGAIGAFYSSNKLKKPIHLMNQIPVVNADVVTGFSICVLLIVFFKMDKASYIPLVLGLVSLCSPFVYLSVIPRLKQMDPQLYEAALDLGCSPFGALRKVVLPQLTSGIVSGFMMSITLTLDDYFITTYTKPSMFDTISTYVVNATKGAQTDVKTALWALSTIIFLVVIFIVIGMNHTGRKEHDHEI